MLGSREILRNRPYFGGLENKTQVRTVSELWKMEGKKVIGFNVNYGMQSLYLIVSPPFRLKNSCWYIFVNEIGTYGRRNGDRKISLERYSIMPYSRKTQDCQKGEWEKEWCLVRTNAKNPQEIYINPKEYQPQYY